MDEYPGDRAATCGGLMEPVGAEQKGGAITLVHRCVRCGHIKRNRAAANDDFDRLLAVLSLGNRY